MRTILAAILTILLATPAWAVPTPGTPTVLDQDAGADPWTFSATVAGGQNLAVLICHISNSVATGTISGATFDSVAMFQEVTTDNTGTQSYLFSLADPHVGTLAVSVDISTTGLNGSCVFVPFSSAGTTLTGVTSANGNETTTDLSVTCNTSGIAISGGGTASVRDDYPHVSQTNLLSGLVDDGGGSFFASYEAGAASVSMQYRFCSVGTDCTPSTQNFSHVGACVNASTARPVAPIMFQ